MLPLYNQGVFTQTGEGWDSFQPDYNFNVSYGGVNSTITDSGTYTYYDPPKCDDMNGIDKWIGCGAGYIGFMFNAMFFDPPAGLELIGFIFSIATVLFALCLLTELVFPILGIVVPF